MGIIGRFHIELFERKFLAENQEIRKNIRFECLYVLPTLPTFITKHTYPLDGLHCIFRIRKLPEIVHKLHLFHGLIIKLIVPKAQIFE